MNISKQTCWAVWYQMDLPLLQNNNIFMSWDLPNVKTFIQDKQTMEADCKKQPKTVCTCMQIIIIKAFFRGEQTLMEK